MVFSIALYVSFSSSALRDCRLFFSPQIILLRPKGISETFEMLVLHQNRAKHTVNGYIPENQLPSNLDFVFWGHEHECRVKPEKIQDERSEPPRSYFICQPGQLTTFIFCFYVTVIVANV